LATATPLGVKRSSGSSVRLPVRVTWLSLTFELLPSFFVGRSYALYRTYVRYVTVASNQGGAAGSGSAGVAAQAVALRPEGGLGAVGDPDALEDAGQVGLDGAFGDAQVAGDLLVGQPVGDQGQDLAFAVAELVLGAGVVRRVSRVRATLGGAGTGRPRRRARPGAGRPGRRP
jgi:hypothetical protein